MNVQKRYNALDGLRTIAALGIILIHIRANSTYHIDGFLYNRVISSMADFVYLFMTISAFSMCCGYYERILNNKISVEEFYSRRFRKIIPFFGLLVVTDLIVSPSVNSLYEAFADMTLLFGFLPDYNNITVIGVGWFLGLIFVFYLIFPFFCTLIANRRRAWIAFIISLMYNYACINYFHVGRYNILFSGCFFIVGGLIYMYREEISRIKAWIAAVAVGVFVVGYYVVLTQWYSEEMIVVARLLLCMAMLILAMVSSGGILDNRIMTFFGGISLELYLSHMFIFRIAEKMGLLYVFGDGWLQFLVTTVIVVAGTTMFAVVVKKGIERVGR